MTVDDRDTAVFRRMGADADLDRAVRIDQPLAHGAGDEGAVIDPASVVEPGVLMGVEMHERERTMLGGMGFEQRPGDEMIAAERKQEGAAVENGAGLPLDCRRCLGVIAIVKQAVAIVDHRHLGEEIAMERILRIVVEDRRCATDCLRPEAGARPIGGRGIKRDTPDDGVRALKILGEAAAHEGKRAGKGRVGGRRRQVRGGEGVIDGFIGHGWVLAKGVA